MKVEAFAFEAVGVIQLSAGQVEQAFFRDEDFYAFGGEEELVRALVRRKRQVIDKARAPAGFDFDADARKGVIFRGLDFPDAVCSPWRYAEHGVKISSSWQMAGVTTEITEGTASQRTCRRRVSIWDRRVSRGIFWYLGGRKLFRVHSATARSVM